MIRKIATLLLVLLSISVKSQCPVKGDNVKPKYQHLDSLKNRVSKGKIDTKVNLSDILKPGDDTKRFKDCQYVKLTGYIILVKDGGSETCNCHSKNKADLDIHIEVALKPTDDPNHAMIVEISRYIKATHPNYTTAELKKWVGKKVTVEGWLFFDEEHKQNAVNTRPDGTNLWRATCWEVHPVIDIELSK